MSAGSYRSYAPILLVFLLSLTLIRGCFAALVELSPDEAYYWIWSKHLAVGYYDHGPVVAWLVRAGTAVFGDSALGVRLGALVCSALTGWMVFVITGRITENYRQAFWAAVLLSVCPIFSVGAVVHTPDAALAVAWSLAVWFSLRAFQGEKIVDWVGVGFSAGVAVLAKMTGALLLVGLGIFVVSCKAGRQRLASPGPAMALLLAVVVALPNLIWNSQHGGGSFAFQLHHATFGAAFSPLDFLAFIGAQAGVVSPLLWIAMVLFMGICWRRSVRFGRADVYMLWCLSAPILLLFALLSLVNKVEANWPVVAYLAALPAAVWVWTGGRRYLTNIKYWVTAAAVLAAVPTVVIHLQVLVPFLPVDPKLDPTAKLRGWRELAREAVGEADALGAVLASEGYGPVSELRFYGKRPVYYERSEHRISQYDLWDQDATDHPILYLQPRGADADPRVCERARERWQLIKEPGSVGSWRAGDFRWWVCEGQKDGG